MWDGGGGGWDVDASSNDVPTSSSEAAHMGGIGGVMIATSHGASVSFDEDHGERQDADATMSLLQIDDEYDAESHHPSRYAYLHYQPSSGSSPTGQARKDGSQRKRKKLAHEKSTEGDGELALDISAIPGGGGAHERSNEEWLVDHEDDEMREKLEKAMRDQQRCRQEELMELERVYSKAMRKTFRSLRGMPEPSFDAPSCLYEEELDALAEEQEERDEQCLPPERGGSKPRGYVRRYFYTEQGTSLRQHESCAPHSDDEAETEQSANSPSIGRASSHHADCQDEASLLASVSEKNSAAEFEEERRQGVSNGGFVNRLRRRTVDDQNLPAGNPPE